MSFTPEIAAVRFGEGLSPDVSVPTSSDDVLAKLTGPDRAASDYPVRSFTDHLPSMRKVAMHQRAYRQGKDGANADDLRNAVKEARRAHERQLLQDFASAFARSITTEDGFRERLSRFWADHFTVAGKNRLTRFATPGFVEEAIRPNLVGKFEELLIAAATHPMMLDYLDQINSVGPNSRAGKRGRRGINENLARELLELHTVGVGARYSQTDVGQLSELLTGLTFNFRKGAHFRAEFAEPGAETVLGRTFEAQDDGIKTIREALRYLARHEATAAHISFKIAAHFTADDPDRDLVDQMTRRYIDTNGDLLTVYQVMLEHPASWSSFGAKVKQPIDFITSGFRALSVPPQSILQLGRGKMSAFVLGPMTSMGQSWFRPNGPDGWPDRNSDWITPHGLAARLQWAMSAPSAIFRALPDPRQFVDSALGPLADNAVRFAAKSAESRREGIGLVLASTDFQRR